MHAAVLHAARDLRIEERDPGPLAPDKVRVRFAAGGICGSDLHYFHHGRVGAFVVKEPLVLGHEIAGEVVELGAEAEGPRQGDRVAVNPARPCGSCRFCTSGRRNLCPTGFFLGSASRDPHMQGGFAGLIDVAPEQCVGVPADMAAELVALAEPLAVCLHAVARGGGAQGRSVLVTGAGPIGLLTLLAARQDGAASVAITDIAQAPLARARALGADHALDVAAEPEALQALAEEIGGFDLALEASGSPAALQAAMEAVGRGGVVVQIGTMPGDSVPVPVNRLMQREIDLRGSMRFADEYRQAVELIVAGAVDVGALITARYPLEAAREALEAASDRSRHVKVMLLA